MRNAPRQDQLMDYDAILETQRTLTSENLEVTATLVRISMDILKDRQPDEKTNFKTAYVVVGTIVKTGPFKKKIDPDTDRFYVMIRDFNKLGMDATEGLVVDYKKLDSNQKIIGEGMWTLPRSQDLVRDEYLWDMKDKKQDWVATETFVDALENSFDQLGRKIFITREQYEAVIKFR